MSHFSVQDLEELQVINVIDPNNKINVYDLLNDLEKRKILIKYGKKHYCQENIYFLIDVMEYKKLEEEKDIIYNFYEIKRKYFEKDSSFELNIDFKYKMPILFLDDGITKDIFDEIFNQIIKLVDENIIDEYMTDNDNRSDKTNQSNSTNDKIDKLKIDNINRKSNSFESFNIKTKEKLFRNEKENKKKPSSLANFTLNSIIEYFSDTEE